MGLDSRGVLRGLRRDLEPGHRLRERIAGRRPRYRFASPAILRHDGQGAAARKAFIALPPGHKKNLLAFLAVL
jgi:hypothetical protein